MIQILETIGDGREFVYVYSFRDQITGHSWPCKIGRSKRNPLKRIGEQQASMQDVPVVVLLLRVDDSRAVEKRLHARLNHRKMVWTFGDEWFKTNASEVKDAFEGINYPDLLIADQFRVARTDRGLTQAQLAALAGVRQGTISKIETGGDVLLETLIKACLPLNMRPILD